MVSSCSASFLLASFVLYLGLSLDPVETAPCTADPITASSLEDPLFIVHYESIEQFEACLSNEVLKANLSPLLEQPLPDDYLAVVKRKLDEIYPEGIPDDQLKVLSYFSRMYSPEEISKWRITSNDTLAALLNQDNGLWNPNQLKQLISTYMGLGGKLTGPLLSMLGGMNLCLLEADQLGQISPESIRQAEKLDISSCSQDKKDVLYEKAREAFADQEGTSAHYPLIQPYLGGAPVEDLRKLARSQVGMDINTFTNLKPEEVKKLSVQDVKDLLGSHLPGLKDVENHPSVATWIKSQLQSELDTLGIGLQGGMASPSPTGSREEGGAKPSITVAPNITTVASTVSAVSFASTSDTNATVFSNTSTFPSVATDSFTTSFFEVTLAAEETSSSTETTNTTTGDFHPEAAVPTDSIATSYITATAEDTISGSVVPTTVMDTNATATNTSGPSHKITTNGTIIEGGRGVDTTTSVETTTVSVNVTTDGDILPSVGTHIHAATTVSATTVSTNIATDGTIQPTVTLHINATTSVNTTLASTKITTDGTVQPTIVSHINTTSSVNTTVASTNATTAWTMLPTVATHVNVTSTSNASISRTPAFNTNYTTYTPNVTVTTSSKQPPASPIPLPNTTVPVPLSALPVTSGKMPAASSSSDTPPKATASPNPGQLLTSIAVTPERGNTSRAPPKTKQPSYPTPHGYIIVKPLNASASSPSLSCLLLVLSLTVRLLVLRGLF